MDDLDESVIESVREVVREAEQPEKVAERILHWMNALSRSESSLDDRAEVEDRLNSIFNAMIVEVDDES